MTQFKCEVCGKVDELDKAVRRLGNPGFVCEECDRRFGNISMKTIEEMIDNLPPSDNTCVCCGEVIPEGRQVCLDCERIEHPLYLEHLAKTHTKVADLGEWNVDKKDPHVDIHKIIDDAMEKRDRTVSIYIGEAGVSVTVSPADQDKVMWIHKADNTYDETYCRTWFQCSNCGHDNNHTTPYCPVCGEFMHGVKEVETNEREA